MSKTTYWFTSMMRRGLGMANQSSVAGQRARVQVRMKLRAQAIGGGSDAEDAADKLVELYGPGDIIGFQPGAVIRTDPRPNVGDFESNYFPFIEFADPDFLWRFTAIPPDKDGNLIPWVTLIVLVAQNKGTGGLAEFKESEAGPGLPRCIIVLKPQDSLPDLAQAWRWAHVQAVGSENSVDTKAKDFAGKSKEFLANTIADFPDRVLCRLLCPRRLLPGAPYTAFVVPTFELGRCAGLGIKPNATEKVDASTFSWKSDTGSDLRLPYYYRWDFGTGQGGDFEQLVRLLEPRKGEEIKGLGTRSMDCSSAKYGVGTVKVLDAPVEDAHLLGVEGVLQPLGAIYTKWGHDSEAPGGDLENPFRQSLQSLLNQNNTDITSVPCVFEKPTDAPPIRNVELETINPITSIMVKWVTDSPMTSKVEYFHSGSETPEYLYDEKLKTEHQMVIKGLQPGALYNLKVGGGQETRQQEYWTVDGKMKLPSMIKSPPNAPPIMSIKLEPNWNPEIESMKSATSMKVKWTTTQPMTSMVEFTLSGSRARQDISDTKLKTKHELVIKGLKPGALYSIRIGGSVEVRRQEFWTDSGKITMPTLPSVAPPIYGRWHAAKNKVDLKGKGWCDELNLDPRHRTAAGFGAEVVRQQQEPLMADAWEQLADAEKANKLLRQAQFVREGMIALWRRIDLLDEDAFLQLTAPIHTRIRCAVDQNTTVSVFKRLREETQIPRASFASAFRRIARPQSILRRRQEKPWTKNVIQELSQGKLSGVAQMQLTAGAMDMEAITIATLSSHTFVIARQTATEIKPTKEPEVTGKPPLPPVSPGPDSAPSGLEIQKELLRPHLKGAEMKDALENESMKKPKEELQKAFVKFKVFDQSNNIAQFNEIINTMQTVTDNWLQREPGQNTGPIPLPDFIKNLKKDIVKSLDPRDTFRKQVWSRIKITKDIKPQADADPLDQIRIEPTFTQPMYEPLRAISQDLILPGIEKVPQNSVLVLKTNRRFLESYMVGLNHEFAAELLWRGYPTKQCGSYFRQFWDVRDRVPSGDEQKNDEDVRKEKYLDIKQIHLWKNGKLGSNPVANDAREYLVILIRGDLFKKYPDTIVYAVNGVPRNVDNKAEQPLVPALREYIRGSEGGINHCLEKNPPIYPIFRGDLPSDLSFFGFPFTEMDAKKKYLVVEQAIAGSALRFGLDMPQDDGKKKDMNDLAWSDFSSPDNRMSGWYLNDQIPTTINGWGNGKIPNSAKIAFVTKQLPVRIAIDFALLLQGK